MCRGGRMFAPTKTWRRWHRRININQKRYAICSALAGSALPALVMAKGEWTNCVLFYWTCLQFEVLCVYLMAVHVCTICCVGCHLLAFSSSWWISKLSLQRVRIKLLVLRFRRLSTVNILTMMQNVSGHRIEEIPEVPLVVDDKVEGYKKTKEAVLLLKKVKAWNDIKKVSCGRIDFLNILL